MLSTFTFPALPWNQADDHRLESSLMPAVMRNAPDEHERHAARHTPEIPESLLKPIVRRDVLRYARYQDDDDLDIGDEALDEPALGSGLAASVCTRQLSHRLIVVALMAALLIAGIIARAVFCKIRDGQRIHDAANKVSEFNTDLEFYVYHLIGHGAPGTEPFQDEADSAHSSFGNINVGNVDGVLSYLLNEAIRSNSGETMCPKKHGMSGIIRTKIRMRTTMDLFVKNMHMGGLFVYENGVCLGRCSFVGDCTGMRDCEAHYMEYGYAPGCSTTVDKPFPGSDKPPSGVVWYSLPLVGRCQNPTGHHECTWSYEDAGTISLKELEKDSSGSGYCCDGICSSFWNDPHNASKNAWRKQNVLDMFKFSFPEQPKTLALDTECDVQLSKWSTKAGVETTMPTTQAVTTATQTVTTTTQAAPSLSSKVAMGEDATLPDTYSDAGSVPVPVSSAPLQEFYVYRPTTIGDRRHHESLGNINVGNLDSVIWYLQNENLSDHSSVAICPRKSEISEIRRYRIRARASQRVFEQGMNMGVQFTYKAGTCVGRCFAGDTCTGKDDCAFHYEKFGFTPGCNNFHDKYPFPDFDTTAPGGKWYSLPVDGRCNYPTGATDCTWSYDDAGAVSLTSLEAAFPSQGGKHCCNGLCTNFWVNLSSTLRNAWRVKQTMDMFQKAYPRMPRDLDQPQCDFNRTKWYPSMDPWARQPLQTIL